MVSYCIVSADAKSIFLKSFFEDKSAGGIHSLRSVSEIRIYLTDWKASLKDWPALQRAAVCQSLMYSVTLKAPIKGFDESVRFSPVATDTTRAGATPFGGRARLKTCWRCQTGPRMR